MTHLLEASRETASGRMVEQAKTVGGNDVVGITFDSAALADGWAEICAYGTAVEGHAGRAAAVSTRLGAFHGGAAGKRKPGACRASQAPRVRLERTTLRLTADPAGAT